MPARAGSSRRDGGGVLSARERAVRRIALAAQSACVASVGLYALCRVVQAAWSRAPNPTNPATIVPGAHAGYFWRVWIASYAGGMLGFLVFAAAPAREAKIARALVVALHVAMGLIVAQGIFVP